MLERYLTVGCSCNLSAISYFQKDVSFLVRCHAHLSLMIVERRSRGRSWSVDSPRTRTCQPMKYSKLTSTIMFYSILISARLICEHLVGSNYPVKFYWLDFGRVKFQSITCHSLGFRMRAPA
jgi:hypothetical protein